VAVKFQALHCANVTDLGLGLGAIYTIPAHIAISFAIAIKYMKDRKPPGSLEMCALSPLPFYSANFLLGSQRHSRSHNLLSGITAVQLQTSLNDLKTHLP